MNNFLFINFNPFSFAQNLVLCKNGKQQVLRQNIGSTDNLIAAIVQCAYENNVYDVKVHSEIPQLGTNIFESRVQEKEEQLYGLQKINFEEV